MSEPREYWAFISYRHLDNRDPGREWATWIAREIETYEVPTDLVGTRNRRGEIIPERLYPVFRDEDELSAGADLSSPIYQALRQSKSLVVICSPGVLSSRYVGNEITYFKSLDRASNVFAIMIDGEPHAGGDRECFPQALLHPVDSDGNLDFDLEAEPIAADLRLPDGRQGWHSLSECRRNLSNETAVNRYRQQCELAKLKIVAGMLDVPLDQLVKRDKAYQLKQAKKRARIVIAVAAALAILAALAIAAGIFASVKRKEALRSQEVVKETRENAEGLVNEIIFDLRDKLENLGKIELLEDASMAAENYFIDLPPELADARSDRHRSVVYGTRGRILKATGDLDGALKRHRDGLLIARRLADQSPGSVMLRLDVAVSLNQVADILLAQNQAAPAGEALTEAASIMLTALEKELGVGGAETLISELLGNKGKKHQADAIATVTGNPGLLELLGTAAVIVERRGRASMISGNRLEAMSHFDLALRIPQALAVAEPENPGWKRGQASAQDKIGNIHLLDQEFDAARQSFQQVTQIAETELATDPSDKLWKEAFAGGLDRLATVDSMQGKLQESLEKSRRALELWQSLAAADPSNLLRQRNLFVGFHKLGLAQSASGDTAAANHSFDKARAIARRLVAADPSNAAWRHDLAFSLERLARNQSSAGDIETALAAANEAVGHHRELTDGDPNNLPFRRNLLQAINALAVNYWARGDLDGATRELERSAEIAARIVKDLAQPTLQSHRYLAEISVSIAQVAEEAGRVEDARLWYEKALDTVLSAREYGLVGDEAEAENIQPLRKKIAELESL